jgi:hypothetical protein
MLSLSEISIRDLQPVQLRLYWTAQAGLTVRPELSSDLAEWFLITNRLSVGGNINTTHGTIQWLDVALPATNQASFIRLNKGQP